MDTLYNLQICPWEWMRQYSHYCFHPPKQVTKKELEEYLNSVKQYKTGGSSYSGYDVYNNKETGEEWLVAFWEVGTKSPRSHKIGDISN